MKMSDNLEGVGGGWLTLYI